MTHFSKTRQEVTTRGKQLFVAVSLSALMAVPALAGDKTRIEMHIGPHGATVETREPDGWREREDLRVSPYDGEVYQYERKGYYGRNKNLRNGDAPEAVAPREDSWGRLDCPQGYYLETNILGRVNCILDENAYRQRDEGGRSRPHDHHHPRSYREAYEQR